MGGGRGGGSCDGMESTTSYCPHATGELNLAEQLNIHFMGAGGQQASSATQVQECARAGKGARRAKADCGRQQSGGGPGDWGHWGSRQRKQANSMVSACEWPCARARPQAVLMVHGGDTVKMGHDFFWGGDPRLDRQVLCTVYLGTRARLGFQRFEQARSQSCGDRVLVCPISAFLIETP